jgi:hypothetical protein
MRRPLQAHPNCRAGETDIRGGAGKKVDATKIYLVGMRFPHHSGHSGYEGFGRYVGIALKPPANFRWLKGAWGWAIDKNLDRLTRPQVIRT